MLRSLPADKLSDLPVSDIKYKEKEGEEEDKKNGG